MDRIPLEAPSSLHDLVAGLYNVVFGERLQPGDIELYDVDSEYVEAEVLFPYVGVNLTAWEDDWSPERRLEVLLHEFAHVQEAAGEPDHGPAFYARLADLTATAEAYRAEIAGLFGTQLDFEDVREHVVDSVNEWTVEEGIESVDDRKRVLREVFAHGDR